MILNLPKSFYEKIPEKVINNIKKSGDDSYTWDYDTNKDFESQNIMIETKALIVQIYRNYLMDPSEKEKWEKLTPAEKAAATYSFDGTAKEKVITQEMRQEGFDNFSTTDDHGMHIVGLFKDANGNKFYKVKNSWGDSGKYNGYFYASEAFVRYKTIDIQINKNALSAEMKKKLGL